MHGCLNFLKANVDVISMTLTRRFWRGGVGNKSTAVSKKRNSEERSQVKLCDLVCGSTIFQDSVVFISATLVYLNTLKGDFVHDDIPAIVRNGDVKGVTSILNIFKNDFWGIDMKSGQSHKSYRPLCVLSFRLNYYLHEFHAGYFHLVNILLHAIVSVLVSVLAREVVFDRNIETHKTKAFVAGVLFALHPIHTEAVANLVGRAELLAAALYIITIIMHNRSLHSNSKVAEFCWLVLYCFCAGCAMLMKETGITVLGVLFTIEAFRVYTSFSTGQGLPTIRHISRMILIIVWTSVLLYFRFSIMGWHQPRFAPPDNPASNSPFTTTRWLTYWYICWLNVKLLLLPIYLRYDWAYGTIPLITSWTDHRNVETLILVGIISYAILSALRKCINEQLLSVEAYGLMLLIVPYIPCSNLLFPVGYVIAERTLYIPSIGFIILVVSGLERWLSTNSKLSTLTKGLLLILILFYCIRTARRNEDWTSKEKLFLSGLKSAPHNAKVRYNWANFLRETERYDEAVQEYEEVLKLYPSYPGALNNLATILEKDDRTMVKAEELYVRLIHIVPHRVEAHMNLANLLLRRGKYGSAAKVYVRLMSRRIIPVMNVVSLANKLLSRNQKEYAELLLVMLLREFCSAQSDVHVMKTLNQLIDSGYNINPYKHCLEDMQMFTKAMSIYARLLDLKGMFEEAQVIRGRLLSREYSKSPLSIYASKHLPN